MSGDNPENTKPEEEVVDMDELSKSTETITKEDEELEEGEDTPNSEDIGEDGK